MLSNVMSEDYENMNWEANYQCYLYIVHYVVHSHVM